MNNLQVWRTAHTITVYYTGVCSNTAVRHYFARQLILLKMSLPAHKFKDEESLFNIYHHATFYVTH
jgi:hypothetical protein